MRLILNGINGCYLREIPDNATRDTELVEAAVAYATNEALLFDWCWENNIPLRFYGRFDETVPVSVRILKTFLDRRSPNLTCKLLKHFHSKVIWWHGVGPYIGSANLTDAAWYNNIEAGCFFEEADMVASAMDIQLQAFFRRVDENASPLSEELYSSIESCARELQRLAWQSRTATSVKGSCLRPASASGMV
jgi:phosphatidylserine/phosphatidylglycerophosphate/cardiolipin synthase-like enzyme